ncbi:hypothetical protein QY049_02955 [Bradyrhizobium sp. WYCCWR 13022]|uniref:hypothetical protein n=1 Tax=unclassified Bradyrhizobium TaxID=2631580 RepID=UPI00263A9537|nr:hypothetical protein [Bradyrhizobium sp. WYCCWR 13022]MDN4982183.1 hypothetical protein [Bradyrhizobium sp. WYCCWR 13022]
MSRRAMRGSGFLAIWSDVAAQHLTDYRHRLMRGHIYQATFAFDARIADFG